MEEKTNNTIEKLVELNGEYDSEAMGSVHFRNTLFYDVGSIDHVNNAGIMDLLDLIKTWSEIGTEVFFVNAKPTLKEKITELNLEKIILFA